MMMMDRSSQSFCGGKSDVSLLMNSGRENNHHPSSSSSSAQHLRVPGSLSRSAIISPSLPPCSSSLLLAAIIPFYHRRSSSSSSSTKRIRHHHHTQLNLLPGYLFGLSFILPIIFNQNSQQTIMTAVRLEQRQPPKLSLSIPSHWKEQQQQQQQQAKPKPKHQQRATKQELEGQDELKNIFLKLWDGKTLCWTVDPSSLSSTTTSTTLVTALQNKVLSHYPEESIQNFYFTYQGKVVRDVMNPLPLQQQQVVPSNNIDNNYNNNNMMYCYQENNVTIFVHYRNPGGCFIISISIIITLFFAVLASFCTCGGSLVLIPILLPFLFILPCFCL